MSLFVRRPPTPFSRSKRRYHSTPIACAGGRPSKTLTGRSTPGRRKSFVQTVEPSLELPELELWRETFPYSAMGLKDRVSVKNPATADKLAKSFVYWNWNKMDEKKEPSNVKEYAEESEQQEANADLESELEPGNGKGKVIIEAFPGPGALTRALMRLPEERVRKLIVLEDDELYYPWLKLLEKVDPRVHVIDKSGYSWETYEVIEELGLLDDVKKQPWEQVHDDLHFISHIPTNIMGEQLVSQFFRCIPDQQWLYKFGRVPMSIILGARMWKRISAAPATQDRCKVSVIAEATSAFAASLPPSRLLPYEEHFHPAFVRENRTGKEKHHGPLISINTLPLAQQVIDTYSLEKWDFCLRRLFVLKRTAIGKAVASLAPGANTLIKYLSDESSLPPKERLDLTKAINEMTVRDWSLVLKAFERWPFAPEDLLISDGFNDDRDDGKRSQSTLASPR
ncbi:S-adenosyl-L-methionine-dependent methyltransferase [Heliocybe sulcata]|uniref:rRNA adenine N(6)-methyltransferase n=1 Tax=Heliocybe sulcata TaxID=5364 RepID=A0A5C3N8L6_9AGAM|nr:S-adenosyl-L-methionine-dependent methyltransferase [Heliocybe sulcata]